MALMRKLLAKQKADKQQAQLKREILLEKRRGYARAGAERARLRKLAESGLSDLPNNISVAIEGLPCAQPAPAPAPVKVEASVEELVARLEAIKNRILKLHAVFAVTLSQDAALEANRFITLFQDIAVELKAKQPEALEKIVGTHGAILMSPPVAVRQTIPAATQRLVELRWEAMRSPLRRARKRITEQIPDGLGWML